MGTSDQRRSRDLNNFNANHHLYHPGTDIPMTSDSTRHINGYTLMVAGRRTGKTSFLRLLLDTSVISQTASTDQLHSVAKFVQSCGGFTTHIKSVCVNVELPAEDSEHYMPYMLTLIDTPSLDFQDEAISHRIIADILRHVDSRFAESIEDEHKASSGDHHVHLCLYFLDPDDIVPPSVSAHPVPLVPRARTNSVSKHDQDPVILDPPVTTNPLLCRPTLPQTDISTIRRLSARVNVLPVIAKADTLTNDRLAALKMAVRRDLADAGIGFGIFDVDNPSQYSVTELSVSKPSLDSSSPYNHVNGSSSTAGSPPSTPITPPLLRLPFALISPDIYSHSDGVSRQVPSRHELVLQYSPSTLSISPQKESFSKFTPGRFTRSYRWASMDVMDPSHCDFVHLRQAIFHHMETLQKYTKEYLFDRFRQEYQVQHPPQQAVRSRTSPVNAARLPLLTHTARPILNIDTAPPHLAPNRHPSLAMSRTLNGEIPASAAVPTQPISQMPELSPKTASSSRSQRTRTKKITVACNFCRSRKLKCDGGRPACGQCFKRSNPCDYQSGSKRRNTRRRKQSNEGSDSDGEGEVDPDSADPSAEMEPSESPEISISSRPPSRRNSKADSVLADITLPPLSNSMDRRDDHPVLPPLSRSAAAHIPQSISESRSYINHDLPPIATLPVPLSAASAQDLSQTLPPLRTNTDSPPVQRRRTSSASTKGSRSSSGYGSKIVACNYCRARKTRCDGGHPTCGSCARRSLSCNYVNDPANGNPKGRPKAVGAGPSAPPSSRTSPAPPGTSNGYSRPPHHTDGSEVDLKRGHDMDMSMPSKKMRMDGVMNNSVAIAQMP
ncbi:TRAFAC class TrmE-Era-EngA-EngB-Septin-like GTPase superfamily protein [Abortiporus biennis]